MFFPLALSLRAEDIPDEIRLLDRKCATFSNDKLEIIKKIFRADCFKGDELQSREYDFLPHKYTSPAKHFYIHYAISGEDSVDVTDKNKNGIPDYIDSVAYYFDLVYDFEVNQVGMKTPPKDNNAGGNDLYDIYVAEIGTGDKGYYGFTYPENQTIPTPSYIVIDNNFSKNDKYKDPQSGQLIKTYNTYGIDALKITAAHEFNHAIQFAYNQQASKTEVLAEMSSTLFEYLMFPEIKDYKYYMNSFLKYLPRYSLFSSTPAHGYYWSTLFIKITESHGNRDFVKEIWNNTERFYNVYDVYNETFKQKLNTNLDRELIDMAEWLYHTGNKHDLDKHFRDSHLLDSLKFQYSSTFSPPSLMYSNIIKPYSYLPLRVVFMNEIDYGNDTLDFFLLNLNKKNIQQSDFKSDNFNITIQNKQNVSCDTTVVKNNYCYSLNSDVNIYSRFFESIGGKFSDAVFPNPFTGESDFIAFPVSNRTTSSKVHLSIYTIDNYCVYDNWVSIGVIENHRAAIWYAIPRDLNNGIYHYKIVDNSNNSSYFGKFAVEKKTND